MNGTILIIEPETSQVGRLPLLGHGTRFEVFHSPEEAFAASMSLQPEAVLVAAQQRRGDGLQLCRNLRDQLGEDVPIIVFGKPSLSQRRRLHNNNKLQERYGFNHFLPRNPSASDLDILLRTFLARRNTPNNAPQEPARRLRPRTFSARRDDVEIAANHSWLELLRLELNRETLRLMWLKLTMRFRQHAA